MPASDKVCIILNPVAGYGRSKRFLPEVEKTLEKVGVSFEVVETHGPGHAEELARELSGKGYRAIVAMGGDGTLNEVVNGVLTGHHLDNGPQVPVATIPTGTGNDFAGGNRLFSHWSHSIDALVKPTLRRMDVLFLKDARGFARYAINSIGIGFDAYVVKRVVSLGSKKIGRLSYFIEAMRGLFSFKPETVKLTIDGAAQSVKKIWLCAITNSEKYGGGMKVAPGAVSYDGLMDAVWLSDVSRTKVVSLLFLVFSGRHMGKKGVQAQRSREICIDAPEGFPCHIDGDTVDVVYPLTIKVIPGEVPFLVKA